LLHHRTDPTTPDPEGYIEYVSWGRMPLEAFRFRYRLMWWGLHFGPRRNRIRMEVAFHAVAHTAALALIPWTYVPALYVAGMLVASSFFAVLAGKGPQTNFGRPLSTPFVKVSARVLGAILFSHDRHLEHHAYPKIPLSRLHHLDQVLAPVLAGLTLVEVSLP
jgi:fatty acid desaturase